VVNDHGAAVVSQKPALDDPGKQRATPCATAVGNVHNALGRWRSPGNPASHLIEAWVRQFKFLGLGLGLMGITMALGTIVMRLRRTGQLIASHMPADFRPPVAPFPQRVRVFQLSTLIGIIMLLVFLIIGIVLAVGVVSPYRNHSIANELNPAETGSQLLSQSSIVSSLPKQLGQQRMAGMAFLFSAITIALTVIIGTLRMQAGMLVRFCRQASR
jgi:hypothetical protein